MSEPGTKNNSENPTANRTADALRAPTTVDFASGFWERVKEHKVLQWTLGYLGAALAIAHGQELMAHAFGWPEIVAKIVMALLILGMPLVLTVAWYHGHRGLKRLSAGELGIISLLILIGAGLLTVFVRQPIKRGPVAQSLSQQERETGATAESEGPSKPIPEASIAVLPFEDLSPEKDQQYFSDGVAEEILNALAHVGGLKVASRTSSFQFRNKAIGVPEIAHDLGVRHVLEGSVRKAGTALRITAQLINTDTDAHLWSQTFDRPLSTETIFQTQDEIANAVLTALQSVLKSPSEAPKITTLAPTKDTSALELFNHAHALFSNRGASVREAVLLYEQAVKIDPTFARAWAELAAAASVAPGWDLQERDYRQIAVDAAERALASDPNQSLAYAVQGNIALEDTFPPNLELAREKLDKALALDPKNVVALGWRSELPFLAGDLQRAAESLRRCVDIDPGYLQCRYLLAMTKLAQGDEDAAVTDFAQLVAKGFTLNEIQLVTPLLKRGDRVGAASVAMAATRDPQLAEMLIGALSESNKSARLDGLARLKRLAVPKSMLDTVLALHLGVRNPVTDYLSVVERAAMDLWDPEFADYRKTPDFKKLVTNFGLPDYWRKFGWGDFCKPLGSSDFECK
jgi:adenylate cyclase